MLAAMPPTTPPAPNQGEPLIRDRGDACPGALRLHPADDGRLARLRLPAGLLTSRQVEVLADAADALGDGRVTVTSRGNVELRGLGEGCGAELADRLAEAGLLPSTTHERVRNIVASPTAGLDGLGYADVQLWARELDALLCAEAWTAALSGRFLFALDDGRGDVAGLGGDVTLIAEAGPSAGGGDALVHVGGQAFRVAGADAPRAALAAADAFLRAAQAAGNGAWRVRELPGAAGGHTGARTDPDAGRTTNGPTTDSTTVHGTTAGSTTADSTTVHGTTVHSTTAGSTTTHGPVGRPGPDARAAGRPAADRPVDAAGGSSAAPLDLAAAFARAGVGARAVVPAPPVPHAGPPVPGALGGRALHVLAPLGRLTAAQLRALLPADEVRLTPWRGAVVVGASDGRLPELDAAGLITRPADPWAGVSACTGRPGCAKSLADVRADATPGDGGLPVHFSGCERRCGHPQGRTWVDVVATADGRYLVDGRPTPRTDLPHAVAAARTPTR
ncbi:MULTISPECIES: cobalamin biosynthesis protein CobG [unclassified Streptomyces]|uniref:cobalamin biosynthesis protein CobG n=1 Tax=Streptomyces sp. NPDC127129 TaxID=3345373 RepID=UPI003627587E